MEDQIVYVELATGTNHDGPAWIGKASRSKTGRTLYFNGRALQRLVRPGIAGNHYDIETGEEYWVSGVKKNQQDRHWAGSGIVMIDKSVVEEYLALIGAHRLDPKKFKIVQLDYSDVTKRTNEILNRPGEG